MSDTAEPSSSSPLAQLRAQLHHALIGQRDVLDQILAALLCEGHVLLEGVPGLGKTLAARALARALDATMTRVQFTPDLMPADILGHTVIDPSTYRVVTHDGPIFTHLLVADEINRAPAKTQAALLEAMQEQQVTLEGRSRALPRPFFVIATQNPLEHEGTYPLPDAQLDRFLLKVAMRHPEAEEEVAVARLVTNGRTGAHFVLDDVRPVLTPADIETLQAQVAMVTVDDRVARYAVDLTRATRTHPALLSGASPRGSIALVRVARAFACLDQRDFATPDDVKAAALPALRHRVTLMPDAELDGASIDAVLAAIVDEVPAPRC